VAFVAVRVNDSHCRKGNPIHLKVSIDLVFLFEQNILSLLLEMCAYMKVYIIEKVNLTTSVFLST
jgi:hypothetical protein